MSVLPDRRRFLGVTAGFAAASIAACGEDRSSGYPIKLGVASYSLREFSRAEAIEMLKTLRVGYVSIKSFHLPYEATPADTRVGADEFRQAGFQVLSGGNIDLADASMNRKMFEYAKAAGLPMMVCAPARDTLDQVEDLVREFDIKIAIHNHGPEDSQFPSPQSALEALEGRDPRMGLCIDAGHTTRTGADVVDWIRRAGPKLLDVHVKDLADLMKGDSQVEVGRGAMPIVGIFRELLATNYQGGVMLEYEIHPNDPLPGMIESIAYMRGVLDGLAG